MFVIMCGYGLFRPLSFSPSEAVDGPFPDTIRMLCPFYCGRRFRINVSYAISSGLKQGKRSDKVPLKIYA